MFWIGFWVAAFGIVVSTVAVGQRTRVFKMALLWASVTLTLYAVYHLFYGFYNSNRFQESLVILGAGVVLAGVWRFFPADDA